MAACEVSPIAIVSDVLISNVTSKTLALAELACKCLEIFAKAAPTAMYHEQQHEDQCLSIIHCLCEVLDQKQMKKVKFAKPALQHIQTSVGGADPLKVLALKAYNASKAKLAAQNQEECKETTADEESKLQAKVTKIIDSLTAKKAAPKTGGIRSFMKTAKTEL